MKKMKTMQMKENQIEDKRRQKDGHDSHRDRNKDRGGSVGGRPKMGKD